MILDLKGWWCRFVLNYVTLAESTSMIDKIDVNIAISNSKNQYIDSIELVEFVRLKSIKKFKK